MPYTSTGLKFAQKFFESLVDEMDLGESPLQQEDFEIAAPVNKVDSPELDAGEENYEAGDRMASIRFPTRKVLRPGLVQDAVVNVIIPSRYAASEGNASKPNKSPKQEERTLAKMIISIWTMEDQRYFTLTFTATQNVPLIPRKGHNRSLSQTPKPRILPKLWLYAPLPIAFFYRCDFALSTTWCTRQS